MIERYSFPPPRRLGLIVHGLAIAFLAALGAWGIWQAIGAPIDLTFILFLLLPLASAFLIPWLTYHSYALWGAYYIVERDSIHLHWGLRVETIPMSEVIWARPVGDPQTRKSLGLPLPLATWLGASSAMRRFPNGMPVEYMASSVSNLVLIATRQKVYAISPARLQDFILVYQHFSELGSLRPVQPRSVYPTFLVGRVWTSWPARILLVGGFLLALGLFSWAAIFISSRDIVYMGFLAEETLPASHIMIIPLVNLFFFLTNVLLGAFVFRWEAKTTSIEATGSQMRNLLVLPSGKVLAYLLWGSSLLTPLLFMVAVYFISFLE